MELRKIESYLSAYDHIAIQNGIAKTNIHHISFEFDFNIISKEQAEKEIEKNMNDLGSRYSIYQWNTETNDYQMFWWNWWYDGKKEITNNQLSFKDQWAQLEVMSYLANLDVKGLSVRVQYKAEYDWSKLYDFATSYVKNLAGNFVKYHGHDYRIVTLDQPRPEFHGDFYTNVRFYAIKKRSKKTAIYLNDLEVFRFALSSK